MDDVKSTVVLQHCGHTDHNKLSNVLEFHIILETTEI